MPGGHVGDCAAQLEDVLVAKSEAVGCSDQVPGRHGEHSRSVVALDGVL